MPPLLASTALHGSILSLYAAIASVHFEPPCRQCQRLLHLSLYGSNFADSDLSLLPKMIRIRIRRLKMMGIHTDPVSDPQVLTPVPILIHSNGPLMRRPCLIDTVPL